MSCFRLFIICALFAMGCTSQEEVKTNDQTTYYDHVQSVLDHRCTRCHNENELGTGDFTNVEVVEAMADLILNSVESGRMPPPASDPECRDYVDSDIMHMPESDRTIIAKWIADGKPRGTKPIVEPTVFNGPSIENPDLEIRIQEPYKPNFDRPNNPGNDYRCFSLEHGRTEPFYITAMHPIVDQPEIVHHVVLAKADADGILAGSTNPEGKGCMGSGGAFIDDFRNGFMLGGWAPGMGVVEFEENTGLLIQPDDYIVIQVHYYQKPEMGEVLDQSGYAFKTADDVDTVIQMLPLGPRQFTIPAGAEAHTESWSFETPLGMRVWGSFPHMHVLGTGYDFRVEKEGTDHCLARSDGFDFENQLTYMFEEPFVVEGGDRFKMSCTWNNSPSNDNLIHNPPIDIGQGERTDEEMCFSFTLTSFN